ncbi:MAG: hypothetical protein WCP34_09555 [Pseudomonadota bacterium]
MDWSNRINELIEIGQGAAKEESAGLIDYLSKLSPDDCWHLLLARDPCLDKLTADHYRYLIGKTIEARTLALWRDQTPEGLLMRPPLQLGPPVSRRASLRRFIKWLSIFLALAVGQVVAFWMVNENNYNRLAVLERGSDQIQQTLEATSTGLAKKLAQNTLNHSRRESRQQQAMLVLMTLQNLRAKMIEGVPFTSELAALEAIWKMPEALAPLVPLAIQGVPGKPTLERDLRRTIDALTTQRLDLQRTWYVWLWSWSEVEARQQRIQKIQSQESQASQALASWQKGDWQGAVEYLVDVEQDQLKHWRQSAIKQMKADQWVADLLRQAWSGFSQASVVESEN